MRGGAAGKEADGVGRRAARRSRAKRGLPPKLAAVAAIVVAGGLLRLGLAWGVPSTPLGDELYYAATALHIARGDGHVSGPHRMLARWPPGQAWWLSHFVPPEAVSERPELLRQLSQTPPDEMDAVQAAFLRRATLSSVLMGTAVVALTAALAGLLFDRRVALLAAALACAYPTFVAASATFWSETLFTALLTAALVGAVAWARRPRAWLALVCGALFGLAALTRELGAPIGAAAGLWWIARAPAGKGAERPRSEAKPSEVRAPAGKGAERPRSEAKPSEVRAPAGKGAERPRSEAKPSEVRAPAGEGAERPRSEAKPSEVRAPAGERRRAAAHAVLLFVGIVVVVLPWTLRNQRELGRVVPVSTVGWMGLREGNTLSESWLERDWEAVREFRRRYVAIPDELERMDMAREEALDLIRDAQPGWLPRKLVLNLSQLLSPDSDLFYKIRQGAYGDARDAPRRLLLVATVGAWVLVFAAGVLGIATAPDRGRRLLPLFVFAPLLVVHVVANAFPKYRVPLVPVLMAYASYGLLRGWQLRASVAAPARAAALASLVVFVACVALFAGDAASLWRGRDTPALSAALADGAARPGRIVLLSMDTVRADAISSAELTPHIASIAAEGVVFSDFYAASSYTIPSHMSIFTGLDPAEHGVTLAHARLSPRVPTLAELLREAGFRTRAFHEGGFVGARFGFARGFEIYRRYPRVEVVRQALPTVLEWMRERGEEPYLLFVHTYAAHFPYGGFDRYRREHPERGLPSDETLREWRGRWPGRGPLPPREAREIPAQVREICTLYNQLADSHGRLLPCGGYVFGPGFADSPHYASDLAALRRSYAERVRLVDDAVGRMRALLEELGQWQDTLFVITSDHGEAFFEHGVARHDFVPFDEVMKVPLVISYPRLLGEAGGRLLEGLTWQLDLFPTLLALAGVDLPGPRAGLDLSPLLRGETAVPEQRAIFPVVLRPAHREQEPERRIAFHAGRKAIEGHAEFGDAEGLLFDLARDPDEVQNLRLERPEDFEALEALAAQWRRGLSPVAPVHQNTGRTLRGEAGEETLEIPAAEQEELRALGYAE